MTVAVHTQEDVAQHFGGVCILKETPEFFVALKPVSIPWVLFIPKGVVKTDIEKKLYAEALELNEKLKASYPDSIHNIAKIGNKNPVYHLHLVIRNEDDLLWPAPIWCRENELSEDFQHLEIVKEVLESE